MGSSNPTPYKHALVFGASGVSGWAVVDQLLKGYPDNERWDKVTALTNRPLNIDVSLWPNKDGLQIVSGINLLKGSTEDLMQVMKDKIGDVDNVTHVFYYGESI
jgi:nucleoside-diphosphate-sugar epimerase